MEKNNTAATDTSKVPADKDLETSSKTTESEDTSKDTPNKKKPSLNFASSMSFKESLTDQEGTLVGNIKMTSVGEFQFTEAEGVTLTGSQHIAVGRRLASLEKSFGKLSLPD